MRGDSRDTRRDGRRAEDGSATDGEVTRSRLRRNAVVFTLGSTHGARKASELRA